MNLPRSPRLDLYDVPSVVATGGTGEVYCARDIPLERLVALEVPLLQRSVTTELLAISKVTDA